MNQENNKKQDDSCPLCESSKEGINRLKLDKEQEVSSVKPSRGMGMIFLVLLIIVGGFGAFRVLSYFSSKPTKATNSIPTQSSEITPPIEDLQTGGPQIASLAPDFSTSDVFGNKVALSDFRGKRPVLLVFWATWCGYCAKEMPDLKIFTERYRNRIQVVAVDSGEPRETIKEYIQKKDINFLILLDETRDIWNQYLVRGTPSHFLIDKQGKIVTLRPGLASLNDLEIMMTMVEE